MLLKAARVAGVNKSGTAESGHVAGAQVPAGSPKGSRGSPAPRGGARLPGVEPRLPGVEPRLPAGVEPGILGWSRAGLGSPWGARLHPKMPGSTLGEPRLPRPRSRPEFLASGFFFYPEAAGTSLVEPPAPPTRALGLDVSSAGGVAPPEDRSLLFSC